jgi:hypothetical protein
MRDYSSGFVGGSQVVSSIVAFVLANNNGRKTTCVWCNVLEFIYSAPAGITELLLTKDYRASCIALHLRQVIAIGKTPSDRWSGHFTYTIRAHFLSCASRSELYSIRRLR